MPPTTPQSSRAEDEKSPPHEPAAQHSRRRGGRPKKTEATGRDSRVHALFTTAEKARVKRAASAGGLSISEYVRRRTLGRPVTSRVDADAERQLRRIGVNLNQLARIANTSGQVERADELDVLVTELRQAIAGLRGGRTPLADP